MENWLVTDNPAKAGKTVTVIDLRFSEEEVVSVILANRPRTLAEAAGKLGTAGININHGYTGTEEGSKEQPVVFAASDPNQGGKILK
jgi:hypothetical protein